MKKESKQVRPIVSSEGSLTSGLQKQSQMIATKYGKSNKMAKGKR